jgi:hypothetical protein
MGKKPVIGSAGLLLASVVLAGCGHCNCCGGRKCCGDAPPPTTLTQNAGGAGAIKSMPGQPYGMSGSTEMAGRTGAANERATGVQPGTYPYGSTGSSTGTGTYAGGSSSGPLTGSGSGTAPYAPAATSSSPYGGTGTAKPSYSNTYPSGGMATGADVYTPGNPGGSSYPAAGSQPAGTGAYGSTPAYTTPPGTYPGQPYRSPSTLESPLPGGTRPPDMPQGFRDDRSMPSAPAASPKAPPTPDWSDTPPGYKVPPAATAPDTSASPPPSDYRTIPGSTGYSGRQQ